MRVGWIGTGVMGSSMCGHLLAAGHEVRVYNRTRGSADHAFLDLHLWLNGSMSLEHAHATSHIVKDRLMTQFPQLVDVVIHIEPPPISRQ